jgi:Protein of unknown function (DUF1566)/Repeat of unknown function (DUF5648)
MTQQCKHWLIYSFIALLAACGSQEGVNTYEAGVNNALPATKAAANSTVSPAENNANASPLLQSLAKLYPNGQLPADRVTQAASDLAQNPAALKPNTETAATVTATAKIQSTTFKTASDVTAQAAADYAPVQRVQNTTLYGAYFFSIYPTEVSTALATNPNWALEGAAFWASLATGTDLYPVHRFRNKTNGSYLYSIYETERADIAANYSATFEYEGVAWYARQTPAPGWSTLYRFRNLTNGTYLFSAFESEKDAIVRDYPEVFKLEGPAYYVRQDAQPDPVVVPVVPVVLPSITSITPVSPATALLGVSTTFTVVGTNLPLTAVLSVQDATCLAASGNTATGFSQACTLNLGSTAGAKTITVKTASAGTVINAMNTITAELTCPALSAVLATRFRAVYKGCIAGVHTFYEKTECVRDSTTGLVWQGQTAAGVGLRANNAPKTNFDSTLGKQNDNSGNPIPATTAQINASTNTIGFKNAINDSNLCGSNAWRLPTKDELVGLVKAAETPKIDNVWFPNVPTSGFYWTSTPHNTDQYAYVINFDDGTTGVGNRSKSLGISFGYFHVRLVHN